MFLMIKEQKYGKTLLNIFACKVSQKVISEYNIKSKQIIKKKMIDNFFQDSYHSSNKVYIHPETQKCIFIGDMQSAIDDDFLFKNHIKTVITAAKDMEHIEFNSNIQHIVYPLVDSKQENIAHFFQQFYQIVEKNVWGGNILVHCAAGISRSSTLVISYIMKKQNKTFKQAIAHVRKERPSVLPNLGFERQLKQYELVLAGSGKQPKIQKRGQVKTSESSKRPYKLKTENLPQVNSKLNKPKLTDLISINMKKLTQQFTEKDIQILKIYQNNKEKDTSRWVDQRKQFRNRFMVRNFNNQRQGNLDSNNKGNNLSLNLPQRQSVSQEVNRDKNVCRKRIKTHLATNQKQAEIRRIDQEKFIRNKLLL